MSKLNRTSSKPLHQQFKEVLISRIDSKEYELGQRLPSEREFSEEFKISRITVRGALKDLEQHGVIKRIPGLGTVLTKRTVLNPLVSFTQHLQAIDLTPSNEILDQGIRAVTSRLAKILQIERSAKIFFLDRLRLANGEPYVWQTAYLPEKLCPNLLTHDFRHVSLYQVLQEEYDLIPVQADNYFEAQIATDEMKKYLKLTEKQIGGEKDSQKPIDKQAVLVMRQISYLDNGSPVEYTRSIYPGYQRFRSIGNPTILDEEEADLFSI